MSEQDSSHLRWEVPPAARPGAGAAPFQTAATAVAQGGWRRRPRGTLLVRGRGLFVAALTALLIGGGASGVAFAADGGHGADNGHGPDRAGSTFGERGGHADAAFGAFDGARAAGRG